MLYHKINKLIDQFNIWLAWKLPDQLIIWCFARLAAYASMKYSNKTPSDISIIDALNCWIYKKMKE